MEVKASGKHAIEVTTVSEPVKTVREYDLMFLKQQRVNIQAQKNRDNASRDAELVEVDTLLAEAEKLGIVEPPQSTEAAEIGK